MLTPLKLKFTPEEDEFLIVMVSTGREKRVSRLAIRLKKPYDCVKERMISLGLIDEKQRKTKFKSEDELDYDLLQTGNKEEELKEIKGCFFVRVKQAQSGESNDE